MGRGRLAVAMAMTASLVAASHSAAALANHSTAELISTGPAGGNGAVDIEAAGTKISRDGARSFFRTRESLVSTDGDNSIDVYQRSGATTTLVSTGPSGGNGAFDAGLAAISDDGARAFFTTRESLVPGDTDSSIDVYERSGTTTTHISSGPNGDDGAFDASLEDISDDGARAYFATKEALVATDADSFVDLYEHSSGTTTHVSTPSISADVGTAITSADGAVVAWEQSRLYRRSGAGTPAQISDGTVCYLTSDLYTACIPDILYAMSEDGTRVFFTTSHSMSPEDQDFCYESVDENYYGCIDIYEYSASGHTLVSTGDFGNRYDLDGVYFHAASANGTRVFFGSYESYTTDDTDQYGFDIHERSGGVTKVISTGPADDFEDLSDPDFRAISRDGTHVYFDSYEQFVAEDSDEHDLDAYERTGTTTNLVSTGPGGNAGRFAGASEDGARVFFETSAQLVASDTDSAGDVYERAGGTTTILPSGSGPSTLRGVSATGTRVLLSSPDRLNALDTDSSIDLYLTTFASTSAFPRPGGATPLYAPLVPAFRQCISPNSEHVAPLSSPSCTPPALQSSLLTTSSVGGGWGLARLDVRPGNPITPADEADVAIGVSAADVRAASDSADYSGQVILTTALRVTDRASGAGENVSATVADVTLGVPIDCVPSADPARGSDCHIATTIDSLLPGFAREGKRTVAATPTLSIYDAGPDGSAGSGCPLSCGTGDESPYLVQGTFTP